MDNKRRQKKNKQSDDAPMEMKISRKPVHSWSQRLDTKKFARRDPRYESSSGEFNETKFSENYAFLKDMRKQEKEELLKQLKQTKDEERKEQINYLINRLTNQEKADEQKEKQKQKVREIREEKGKKVFVNKSHLKKLELVEKFKELKKSSKLDKYMQRKRKKNISKDRKKFQIKRK